MNNNVSNIDSSKNVFVFDFAGHEVRALKSGVIGKQPWFLGNDIAKALLYKRPGDALSSHVSPDDLRSLSYKGFGKTPKACKYGISRLWRKNDYANKVIINKPGAFNLILHSHAPNAKRFQYWLTHDVLPQIDETGNYISNDTGALMHDVAKMGPNHIILMLSRLARKTALDNIAKKRHIAKLAHENHQMLPDYEYGHNIHIAPFNENDNLTTFANTLKSKGLFNGGSIKLGRWLRNFRGGFLIKRHGRSYNMPKSQYTKYFYVSVGTTRAGYKYHQTLINTDGQVYFTNLLAQLKHAHTKQM